MMERETKITENGENIELENGQWEVEIIVGRGRNLGRGRNVKRKKWRKKVRMKGINRGRNVGR